MFSFLVDPDLQILFEKLTAQIRAHSGLGPVNQLRLDALGDLGVDIIKMQQSKSG